MLRICRVLIWSLALYASSSAAQSWYGIVMKAPDSGEQDWVIDDQVVAIGPDVEVKASSGRLMIGACARVEQSEDAKTVVKVQTSPMIQCDHTDYPAYFETFRLLAEE